MVVSWLLVSLLTMLVPVLIGRQLFAIFLPDNSRIYELYTSATGIYICIIGIKAVTLTTGWIQEGWQQLSQKMKEWAVIVSL